MGSLESLNKGMSPWFRAKPRTAVAVALALFVGVTVLRWFYSSPGDATSVLYVFPIALLALTFGVRGGIVGALAGFGLFVLVWAFMSGHVPVLGWVVRGTAMFLMGFLLGRAADQIYAHERAIREQQSRQYELERRNRRYIEVTEQGDSILQHVISAKWLIEQDRVSEATEVLTSAIEQGQDLVGELLPRNTARLDGGSLDEMSSNEKIG